jgi:hypothetical protein
MLTVAFSEQGAARDTYLLCEGSVEAGAKGLYTKSDNQKMTVHISQNIISQNTISISSTHDLPNANLEICKLSSDSIKFQESCEEAIPLYSGELNKFTGELILYNTLAAPDFGSILRISTGHFICRKADPLF